MYIYIYILQVQLVDQFNVTDLIVIQNKIIYIMVFFVNNTPDPKIYTQTNTLAIPFYKSTLYTAIP